MTVIFDVDELRKEKQLHLDWVFFVGDKEKNPQKFVGSWKEQTSQTTQELEILIEGSQKRTDEAWNWGIRTGIKNIACLDFDWEFLYYRWLRSFGDRAETVTYRTANKGFRVLFRTRETENDNPYKNSLHTEFENAGYAVIGGYAEDIEGKKQPYYKIKSYTLYNNKSFSFPNQIATDNTIIADTKKWLAEQQERYDFLQYKCVNQKNSADRKHITLTHDQRLAILNFMLQKGFDDEEIHDFFSTVYDAKGRDYDKNITQTQIESGRKYKEKNGKPHPCKPKQHDNGHVSIPLYQIFTASPEHCKGCLRKRHSTETATTEVDMEYALQHLNSKFTVKCPTDTRELLAYENGCYTSCDWKVAEELEKLFGEELKTHFVEETLNHLERANYITRDKINNSAAKIPLKNGILNLNTLTLEPFDPEQVFTYKLNVEYNPEATYPKWLEFVKQIVAEDTIPLLQEIMGYCLLPAMPFHKLFWFYGVGRNGKGVIIRTLEAILGKDSVSNLNISEFSEVRRFSLQRLYGKLINISSEPALSKYGLQTNILKKISGQDTIDAEIKGKNDPLTFVNVAKPIILGNRFPKVEDNSLGWWDRVIVLNFPNSFEGEKEIPDIENRWLPEETSGIFNWMLEGLYRIYTNKGFSSSKSTEETKTEFMRVSDPFNAWLIDCCGFVSNTYLTREEAYNSYRDYSDELGADPDSPKTFYSKMRQTPRIKDAQKRINGKMERIFQGISLKTESEADEAGEALLHTQETVQENNCKKKQVKKTASSASSASVGEFNVDSYFPSGQFPVCFACHETIVQLESLTNIDGRPIHKSCKQKIDDQKKGAQ